MCHYVPLICATDHGHYLLRRSLQAPVSTLATPVHRLGVRGLEEDSGPSAALEVVARSSLQKKSGFDYIYCKKPKR